MAYCMNCGKELAENAPVCVNCGTAQAQTYSQEYAQEVKPEVVDKGGFLWGLLGCCIPIVGLILFLVWKDTKPKTAKAAGIGALVSVICLVVYYVLIIVIAAGAGVFSMM